MEDTQKWYIIKLQDGHCEILPNEQIAGENQDINIVEKWGPLASKEEAIARRVGLIRAGKCQPV
jgi:hypothetical protein